MESVGCYLSKIKRNVGEAEECLELCDQSVTGEIQNDCAHTHTNYMFIELFAPA